MEFTEEDIKAWRAYEKVRKGGRYNMLSLSARHATGLNSDRYSFVLKNFMALKEAAMKNEVK